MELDRKVSEYMQKRNMLATKVAGIVSAQLLLMAVFFCALNLVAGIGINILIMAMILLTILIAVCGIIVLFRNRRLLYNGPDDIGLRQSSEIIEQAYEIAKPALVFNMTVSGIIMLLGFLISLFTSGIVFILALAFSVMIFIPSFDRNYSYRKMLSRHIEAVEIEDVKHTVISVTAFLVLMSSSICIFLIWKYFGSAQNDIAWIVFCIAGTVQGAIMVLSDNNKKCDF